MRKTKINRENNVKCSIINSNVSINKCKQCEYCFGIVPYSHVNCKRGLKIDEFITKK